MEDPLNIAIQLVQAISLLVLGTGALLLAFFLRRVKRSLNKVDAALGDLARDARPVLDRARAVGENLNFIVMSVRKDVERVGETVARVNSQLETLLDKAEEHVRELGGLIDVVHEEVEDTLLTATSAIRGIRAGAQILTGRRPPDDDESEENDDDND